MAQITQIFGGMVQVLETTENTESTEVFWGLHQPQVAGRTSRVNLSCCDHAVAYNRASNSPARVCLTTDGTIFGGMVAAIHRPNFLSSSRYEVKIMVGRPRGQV